MHKLAQRNKDKVLDLLTERLAFERSSVKLYDTVIDKMRGSSDPGVSKMFGQMKEHRDQEKQHEEWLEEQIRAIGGDAHAKTDGAELVERESKGIEDVIRNDEALPHLFHALLTAELADNAGWELLLELADDADDDDAREALKERLHEEQEHLVFVRQAVSAFARRRVLEQAAQMPSSP